MNIFDDRTSEVEGEHRRHFLDRLIELNGGPIRCARRREGTSVAGSKEYLLYPDEATIDAVHYRSILQCQTVFDIGDNTPWPRTATEANALMATFDSLGIDYLPALSGGKGFHIEVFTDGVPGEVISRFCGNCSHPPHRDAHCATCDCVDPYRTFENGKVALREHPIESDWSEWRLRFHSHILSICPVVVAADPLLKAPNPASRLVRDFGQQKHSLDSHRKWLWPKGETLPDDREEAYCIASDHNPIPRWVPVNRDLAARYDWSVKGCPRGPRCHDPTSNGGFSGCGACPLWN